VVVSGVLDEETQEAIKQYQKKFGLPETGKPGEKSLRALKDYLTSIVITKA
jgi:peptidoglycan hydrolase-like protein with peptidoglycan-binding domain